MSSRSGEGAAGIAALRDGIAAAAAAGRRCLPRGGGTKDALSTADDRTSSLDVGVLAGIVEYEPSEFTVTALAGTPIAELGATLAGHGQYLPFDPILVEAGATVGGTVAAGVSGSGRIRYGGIRDFVLGVRFLNGGGTLVRGGGKVVKNAAGFDLPKLMVGSLGALGVLVEVTLKVFPRAESTMTGCVDLADLGAAVTAMRRLLAGPSEVDALDLEPPGRLWIRIAGRERALAPRLERALAVAVAAASSSGGAPSHQAPAGAAASPVDRDEALTHWRTMRELAWVPGGCGVIKVPLQPGRIAAFEAMLRGLEVAAASAGAPSRAGSARPAGRPFAVYTAGGQQALVAWPDDLPVGGLDRALQELSLSGLVVRGRSERRRLGRRPAEAAIERVRLALDPNGRFREP